MRTDTGPAPTPTEGAGLRAKVLQLFVSFSLTGLFGWWAFRDTRWSELWASLRSAHYVWLLPTLVLLTVVHVLRALRWGNLLSGLERLPFRALNRATAVGNMIFLLLPLRLGEFARPVLISRHSRIRPSAAMASVVLERIIDGVAVALMLEVALLLIPGDGELLRWVRWGTHLMLAGFLGLVGFLLVAHWQQERVVGLLSGVLGRVSPALARKVTGMVETFVGALRQMPPRPQALAALFHTVGIWFFNGLALAALAQAFGCANTTGACVPLRMSLFESFLVLGVIVLGGMIPAAPGMAGTYQASVRASLALFLPAAVVSGTGIAFANVMWLSTTLHQVVLGLVFILLEPVSLRQVRTLEAGAAETP